MNTQTDVIYTDFKKAFDRIDHNLLISKLNHYGIKNPLLSWFSSFLTERFQIVKYNEFFSNPISITSGVPQGDHISPLLFLLYINDISSSLKHTNILLFADDAKLYKTIYSVSDALKLQSDLDAFCDWCTNNGMELNINKCSIISFSQKKTILDFNYNFINLEIKRVYLINDLGVFFDTKMNFKQHINKIKNKASSKLGFLKRQCSNFNNHFALKNIYFSIVRSQLEYAAFIWSPNSLILNQTLDSVQNSFLRFLSFKCNVERLSHSGYEGVSGFFNIPTLRNRRKYLAYIFLFNLLNNKIECQEILERLNFKAKIILTRNNDLFTLKIIRTNYSFSSPINSLMSIANSVNLDLFFCNINSIKSAFNV